VTITATTVMSFLLSLAGLSRTIVSWSQVQSGLFVREKVGFRLLCSWYGMEKAHRASMLEDFVTARYDFIVQVQRIVRYISLILSIA
jgi:hypothetical protein